MTSMNDKSDNVHSKRPHIIKKELSSIVIDLMHSDLQYDVSLRLGLSKQQGNAAEKLS